MKKLSGSQQKLLKSIHMLAAGLWLSCVVMLTALPLISGRLTSGDELFAYNLIYHFIDMDLLTPAAIMTLLTGLTYSIFTRWGFVKHGWIIYKWIVTLAIIIVGTFYLGPMVENLLEISDTQRVAALDDQYYKHGVTVGLWAGFINTSLLVMAVLFSIYKPWKNLTR
jgi:hypothetical protein